MARNRYVAYTTEGKIFNEYTTRQAATDAYQVSSDIEFVLSPAGVVIAGERPVTAKKGPQVTATLEKDDKVEDKAEEKSAEEKGPRGGDGGASLKRLRTWAEKNGFEVVNGTKVPATETTPGSYKIDLFKDGQGLTFEGPNARAAYGAALKHIRPISQDTKRAAKEAAEIEKKMQKEAAKAEAAKAGAPA